MIYFKRSLLLLAFVISLVTLKAQPYNFYFGNIHAHSDFSDGNQDKATSHVQTPAGCFAFAKQSKHFDLLGISEHNHTQAQMQLANYSIGLQQANNENEDGTFVCMYGMEYGVISTGGHVIIYGIDSLIGWEPGNFDIFNGQSDYKSLWRLLAARPNAFATLAHPKDKDFNNLLNTHFDTNADAAICGVCIKTGPAKTKIKNYSAKPPGWFYSYYRRMLAAGYKLGPTIDHDTHNTVFGRSHQSRTVVLARKLSRDSIMSAYRAMRFYASQDWNAKVNFFINDQPMGSIISSATNVDINVTVVDDDPTDKVKSIRVLFGKPGSNQISKVLTPASVLNGNTLHFTQNITNSPVYYYIEVIQKDGDKIYTSPIWIND
jgi:hypothetical protein